MPDLGPDYIAIELLKELKAENDRKDKQIRCLYKILVVLVVVSILIIGGFLWYLYQYDFSSYQFTSAEGVYAIADSDGNVISSDLTPEDIANILGGMSINGTNNDSSGAYED